MRKNRDFQAAVVADLKAKRKRCLAQGLDVSDIDASLARYGVTVPAVETKTAESAPQKAVPAAPAPAKKAAPPAKPGKGGEKPASTQSPSTAPAGGGAAKSGASNEPGKGGD